MLTHAYIHIRTHRHTHMYTLTHPPRPPRTHMHRYTYPGADREERGAASKKRHNPAQTRTYCFVRNRSTCPRRRCHQLEAIYVMLAGGWIQGRGATTWWFSSPLSSRAHARPSEKEGSQLCRISSKFRDPNAASRLSGAALRAARVAGPYSSLPGHI